MEKKIDLKQNLEAVIKSQWKKAKEQIEKYIEKYIKESGASNDEELELLKAFLGEINDAEMLDSEENIFNTIRTIGNIEKQIDLICLTASSPSTTIKNVIQGLKQLCTKLLTHLWQYLAQYSNLSQWSATGSGGANLFGLSGNVGITLVFKKRPNSSSSRGRANRQKNNP